MAQAVTNLEHTLGGGDRGGRSLKEYCGGTGRRGFESMCHLVVARDALMRCTEEWCSFEARDWSRMEWDS